MSEKPAITICAVGDLIVERPNPELAFEHVSKVLAQGDLLFGNCEAVYRPGTWPNPVLGGGIGSNPDCFAAIADAGFKVMSVANNHFFDWGVEGLNNTLQLFEERNMLPVGAGANIDEAWKPVIIEINGVRVGFVACAAVFPPGAAATASKAGCAGVRVYTVYQAELGQPGTSPEIRTFVDPADEKRLVDAIAAARANADVVILSCHWGIHQAAISLADYESHLGRAAIDAGADVVLGHHQHILKGVEVYKGRYILHGLGNFVCDLRIAQRLTPEQLKERVRRYGVYGVAPKDDYPSYPFHPDARNTVVARIRAEVDGPIEVDLVPCHINPDGQPVALSPADPRFDTCVEYIRHITNEADLPTEFVVATDALRITS